MRLRLKIFLQTIIVLSIALGLAGYLLISISFNSSLSAEIEKVRSNYQYVKFSVETIVINSKNWPIVDNKFRNIATISKNNEEAHNQIALINNEGTTLYSEFNSQYDFKYKNEANANELIYEIEKENNRYNVVMYGKIQGLGEDLCLVVGTDITKIISQKTHMQNNFILIYIIGILFGIIFSFLLASLITKPIQKLKKHTIGVGEGNYSEHVKINTNDEISELVESFNNMTDALQDKINKLELAGKQKEEFVANFAHELKTPLTSIIGYADMLYQREFTREQVKESSNYILNEGLRLEALSFKLLDLITTGKQSFKLEELRSSEVFYDIAETIKPEMDKKKIELKLDIEDVYIKIEFDLFKTMILNLIDNAKKANASKVTIKGKCEFNRYMVIVSDNGSGIPKEELSKITEAFYMVDKARSRNQHSVGLGLSLCEKIAEVHGTYLEFESEVSIGTNVTLKLEYVEEEQDE